MHPLYKTRKYHQSSFTVTLSDINPWCACPVPSPSPAGALGKQAWPFATDRYYLVLQPNCNRHQAWESPSDDTQYDLHTSAVTLHDAGPYRSRGTAGWCTALSANRF